jgi:pilus assembly protein CpaB
VLACACATLAVLCCLAYADGVRAEAEEVRSAAIARYGGEVVTLVVAKGPLEEGRVVTEADVVEREWLADLAPADALTSLDDVVGRTVSVAAAQGSPLTSLNFRESRVALEPPSGHVALTVPLSDKLAISRDVGVGSNVAAYEAEDGGARLIASGLEVLAVSGQGSTVGSSSSLTLAVMPEDVPALLAASAAATLRLVVPADDVTALVSSEATQAPASVGPETAAADLDAATTTNATDRPTTREGDAS